MPKSSTTSVSNRVDTLGKTMNEFEQRLDSLLAKHSNGNSNNELPVQLEELKSDFLSFKAEATQTIAEITSDIRSIKVQLNDTSNELDELNQYSRRNCLLVHGIPETPNENVDALVLKVLNENLKLTNINLIHIDRCHRIGAPKRSTASVVREGKRAIIIKFTSYRFRNEVWKSKKLLKGTQILITESLTPRRQKILKLCKDRFGFRQVWSQDGRIVVFHNNRRFTITSEEDLQKIV